MATGVQRQKRIRVEPNLYKIGDVYYYRKGRTEKALGVFPNDKIASQYKAAFEAKRSDLGIKAFKFRAKDLWPDYLALRQAQMEGKIAGRKQDSPRTFHEIDSVWKLHLRKFFGNKKLAEISAPLWTEYVERASVADLVNHRKVLTTFLGWTVQKGYLNAVPSFVVPEVKRRKRRILTPLQITALLKHSHGKLLLFNSLYLFMGMRYTESQKLAWESVSFKERALIVKDETTRTRKGRPIPINKFVYGLLVEQRDAQKMDGIETPWVFPKRGHPELHMTDGGLRKAFATALKTGGLSDITPHDLRATYEYYANKSTAFTDTQRAKMAGASIEMQRNRYVSFEADDLRGLEEVVDFAGLAEIVNSKSNQSSSAGVGKISGNEESI